MAYPVLELDLNLVDDFVQVTIVEGIDTVRYKADRQLMDDVQRIFSERRMYRYKSSYRPKLKVLDGYSWHYSAKFADGESFSSSGNNAWPRGDAFDAIADLVKGYSPE